MNPRTLTDEQLEKIIHHARHHLERDHSEYPTMVRGVLDQAEAEIAWRRREDRV